VPKTLPKSAPAGDTPSLDTVLERNIQALIARRKEDEAAATRHQGFATVIGRFIGSFGFVYTHLMLFGLWVLANTIGLPTIPAFDPELFYMATFAAVEAIFLTTLVLINQNRMSAVADKRAELELQITLLTEHELTRLLHLVSAVADRLNVRSKVDEEIEELKQDVAVSDVLDKIEDAAAEPEKMDAAPRGNDSVR
jgi:uncharacterized membrane protein